MTYIESRKYPRTEGRYDLAGRIEPVRITKRWPNGDANGTVRDGDSVFVHNGAYSLDKVTCLVRFDLVPRTTRGNFVSSDFPFGFKGLPPKNYILWGTWTPWMKKKGKFPTPREMKGHYDQGPIDQIVYFSKAEGPWALCRDKDPQRLEGKTALEIIRKGLPHPLEAPRIVIGESDSSFSAMPEFLDEIREQGIHTFKLDNLSYNLLVL